jgi:hypothetical protein
MNMRHVKTGGPVAPIEVVDRPGCRRHDRTPSEDPRGDVHLLRAAADTDGRSLRLAAGLSWAPVESRDAREGSGCDR